MKREAKIYPISRRRYWKKSDSTIDPFPPLHVGYIEDIETHGNSRIGRLFLHTLSRTTSSGFSEVQVDIFKGRGNTSLFRRFVIGLRLLKHGN